MSKKSPPTITTPLDTLAASTIMANATAHKQQHAELIKTGLDGLFTQLSTYLTEADCSRIRTAFLVADAAHLGQYRQTGEPYITHPIAVATLCASWKLDGQSIMAALLHDVLEDTGTDKITLAHEFGAPVANLVDGLSKLDKLHFDSKEAQQAESFRKMLLAMADDVRVILVKLADRLHNLSTMGTLMPEKRRRIAHETLEIYAPIAHRLGLDDIYRQLQDLCFHQTHPIRAAVLEKALQRNRGQKRELFTKILDQVCQAFEQAGLDVELSGREKNLASIYQKMKAKKLSLSKVLDVYAFRIIVKTRSDCYVGLGVLHGLFKFVPGRFKDYISLTKKNGYQSLHTTVLGPYGTPVEFQIRTHDMHRIAESGIATHWLYKDKDISFSDVQKQSHLTLQSLFHIQQKTNDSIEFLEHIKVDLSPDAVYVFTPKSRILTLPRHATALDFAYSIHTDIGSHAVSARINDMDASLSTELHNGDRIHIVTDPAAKPHLSWMKWVKTGKARSELRHYFKSQRLSESAHLGQQLFKQALETANLPNPEVEMWEKLLLDSGCKTKEELFSEIGLGIRDANITIQRLLMVSQNNVSSVVQTSELLVKPEVERLVIRGDEMNTLTLSKCCHPIRGDAIVGHLLRRQGLIVHTSDCPTARTQRAHDNLRWINLEWDMDAELADPFSVALHIVTTDERGLLAKVASKISEAGANIEVVHSQVIHNQVHVDITIDVTDRVHLAQVFKSLRTLPQVNKIARRFGHRSR
ncbi:RelA/SpoT family protein [Hydromonas duriensis]|uniref:GTP pyrophosphokinase n=1 Tax=Hydromonas duriensis TaxID=1527608 RepID=A0A4R6Y4S6_9BURK|nr:bifunctional (p)ppGpp synthetase/guanosine-3',5'-bis(diphosphate) 3'-pyrophosphohydrolase [Hydromonas duriensis]TDR28867.1 GTP pyrophosphokinase [Hydromonas duriensis]